MVVAHSAATGTQDTIQALLTQLRINPRYSYVADRVRSLLIAAVAPEGDPLGDALVGKALTLDSAVRERLLLEDVVQGILEHDMLTTTEVGNLFAGRWKNPSDALAKKAGQSRLLRLAYNRKHLYPAFQFRDVAGAVWPTKVLTQVEDINQLLQVNDDPWAAASWWLTPSDSAGGRAPAALIGTDQDRLRQLAEIEMNLIDADL